MGPRIVGQAALGAGRIRIGQEILKILGQLLMVEGAINFVEDLIEDLTNTIEDFKEKRDAAHRRWGHADDAVQELTNLIQSQEQTLDTWEGYLHTKEIQAALLRQDIEDAISPSIDPIDRLKAELDKLESEISNLKYNILLKQESIDQHRRSRSGWEIKRQQESDEIKNYDEKIRDKENEKRDKKEELDRLEQRHDDFERQRDGAFNRYYEATSQHYGG